MNDWILVALAGVLGYVAARVQQWMSRKETIPVVATALLTELQSLEIGLRRLAKHAQPAKSTLRPRTANFASQQVHLTLFERTVARDLVVFYGLVGEINDSRDRMLSGEYLIGNRAHQFVRAKAIAAANRIPALRESLRAVGGIEIPDSEAVWTNMESPPVLGDAAFPTTARVPNT